MAHQTSVTASATTAADLRWRELMAASQRGEGRAYETLLRECQPAIRRMARLNGVATQDLDDVVQDTLVTLHRARHTYDASRPFLPWLRAVVQRRGIDQMRRSGRKAVREVHAPLAIEAAPDPADSAEQHVVAQERAARLYQAVATLPAAQRAAVQQLGLRERSLAETSAASGRSVVALKVTLHRAIKSLRQSMVPLEA